MEDKKLGRRDVLRGLGLAAAGAAVAACQPKTVIVKETIKETVIVEGTPKVVEKEVTRVIEKEVTAAPVAGEIPEVHMWPCIALVRPEGSHPAKYDAVQTYITEQTGIKPVGYVPPPGSAGQEKLNLLLGSKNERLDIFTGNWPDYKDIILPINDLLDMYGQDIRRAYDPMNFAGMYDLEGNIWGVPRLGLMGHCDFTWFRTDWMDELGIAFSDDEMTWQQMEEIIAAFKDRDPDSVVVTNGLASFRRALVGGWTKHGYINWFDESDGRFKPPELQPGFVDWVAKMNEWWNKNWFHKEFLGGMDFEEVLRSGKMGVHAGHYSRITILGQRIILENVVPNMDFAFPKKLMGNEGMCMVNRASMSSAHMITKKCPDPEAAIKFINWQHDPSKDNAVTAHFGIPGEDWEWVDPNDKFYVRRLTQIAKGDEIYAGEFYRVAGLGPETWYAPEDPLWARHYEHIRDYATNYVNGKMPFDYDVPWDYTALDDEIPGMEDINRLVTEETTKFIVGIRPLTEWNDFVDTLYKAGLEDWIEAHTKQYLVKHPL